MGVGRFREPVFGFWCSPIRQSLLRSGQFEAAFKSCPGFFDVGPGHWVFVQRVFQLLSPRDDSLLE